MNYTLTDLPDSGQYPVVYMDIKLKGEIIGRIYIRLFRDVFPAGVENFVKIASSMTYQVIHKGSGNYKYVRQVKRTFDNCKFYHHLHNNYIVCGDIYSNNGKNAGTVYDDEPIPADFGNYYYPHETKGLVSLVPFKDETTGKLFYDSTFMITLDDSKPSNILSELDNDQIVIGQVYSGVEILDQMNKLIKPFANRTYPVFSIGNCDTNQKQNRRTRRRPIPVRRRQFAVRPTESNLDCES